MTLKRKHDGYNCADIEKLAQRYLDEELSDQEKILFDEHIEYCLPCDKKIEFEGKLKEMIRHKGKELYSQNSVKDRLRNMLNEME